MDIENKIKDLLKGRILASGMEKGQSWFKVAPEEIIGVLKDLTAAAPSAPVQFDMLTDICGVDNHPEIPRFTVIYHLLSTKERVRLRIKVDLAADSDEVPSAVSVFKGANWMEREAYDMYGIRFSGHPDLRRILMHEDFEDFPQRKDFPLRGWREEKDI